jgi:hypothetical protein
LRDYQTNTRKRSDLEIKALRETAIKNNSRKVICPYCNKEGQFTAMHRWHFENCKLAPNPSIKSQLERQKLSENMTRRNKKH